MLDIEELSIINNDKTIYDLQGRIINKPTNGFYVQNGEKYIIIK